jgi:microcin C transport system substrate-binding protein
MNKNNTLSALSLLLLVSLSFMLGCKGNDEPVIKKIEGAASGAVDPAKLKQVFAELDSLSAEQGGKGFEAIAAAQGWKTASPTETYGDPNAKKGGTITLAEEEFPTTFRAIGKDARFQTINIMTSLMYETLLGLDGKTMDFLPGLATHWKVSEDKMTYEFRIDPRARWADGMPVVADDVIATYKLYADEGHGDPNYYTTYRDELNVPEKVSPYIVRVLAKRKSWSTFNNIGLFMKIFPAHYIGKIDGKGYVEKYQYQTFPGTGPYEVDVEKTKNPELLVLKRRAGYWAEKDPANIGANNFDEIHFLYIMDEKLRLEKFKKGEYDYYIIPRAQWWKKEFDIATNEDVKRGLMQKVKMYNFNPKGMSGLAFNTKEEPFKDIKVRKALSMLWNFDQLNDQLFFSEYVKNVSYYQNSVYQNMNNPQQKYDPTAATALLKEVGYEKKAGEKWLSKGGKPFELDLEIDKSQERIFTPLQQDLEKVGIKLNLVNILPQARFEKTMKKQFKMTYQNWGGTTFPNPEGSMHSKYADKLENSNITSMAVPRIDELSVKYEEEFDVAKRIKMVREIDSLAVAQCHYAFGWIAPYTVRAIYWNKFDHPKCGVTRTGDYEAAFTLWWYNAEKDAQLQKAKSDKSITMPVPNDKEGVEYIDCWGVRSGAKSAM